MWSLAFGAGPSALLLFDAAFEAISNAKHASCVVFSALDVFGPFMRKRTVLFIVHNYGNPTPTEHGLFPPSCRGSSARLADLPSISALREGHVG